MMQNRLKKHKPLLYDPHIISNVRKYLEENVHQTYVDVGVMARKLQERHREYTRRKSGPFRQLVEEAYRIVVQSYGIESNSSDGENNGGNSDLEMVEEAPRGNHVNELITSMYQNKSRSKTTGEGQGNYNELIDISSDDNEEDNTEDKEKTSTAGSALIKAGLKTPAEVTISKVTNKQGSTEKLKESENPVASFAGDIPQNANKKRKVDHAYQQQHSTEVPKMPPLTTTTSPVESVHNLPVPPLKSRKFKKEVIPKTSQYTFRDVGGMGRILKDLCELLFHLKRDDIYYEIGISPPKGLLLHGPPGCGKTLLAHAIAGQLEVGIIEVPATELIAGVSGESEERIREVFQQAATFSPCILFLDEIDAISSNRLNAQRDMERRIVSQLISSLDGLSKLEGGHQVLVVGATNRPEALDPALRRVGRFDHEVCIGIPDRKEREQILNVVCDSLCLDSNFDYKKIAELTPGYVGGDILALATRAASLAIKRMYLKYIRKVVAEKRKNIPVVDLIEDSGHEIGAALKGTETTTAENGQTENLTDPLNNEIQPTEAENQSGVQKEVEVDPESNEKMAIDETAPLVEEPQKTKTDEQDMLMVVDKETTDQDISGNKQTGNGTESGDETIDVDDISDGQEQEPEEATLPELILLLSEKPSQLEDANYDSLTFVTMDDFKKALKLVQPSAKREGFITVPDVTWNDIGSLRDIREELQLSVLAPVKYPEKMTALGLDTPSGVLLCGPPGCGKTLLAKAIANEAGINFISVKGPELINMYVGESERAVRQCFQRARSSAPCVIFFDEFDSLCPRRSDSGDTGGSARVVNQLLTEMDGIEERKGVFLMAATNRPDIIDPAVLRPGRLDTILYVGLPEEKDRVEIMEALTKNRTQPVLADDVDLAEISKLSDGFTGADLAGLIRQAAILTLKESLSNPDIQSKDLKVHERHLLSALKLVKPSVNSEDKKMYERLKLKYATPRSGTSET